MKNELKGIKMGKIKEKNFLKLAKDENNSCLSYLKWNNSKYDTIVMNMILLGIYEIDKLKHQNKLNDNLKLILHKKDLERVGFINKNYSKKEFEKIGEECQKVSIRLEKENGFRYMTIFPTIDYDNGVFELTINPDVIQYYKLLESNFTQIQLLMASNLSKSELKLYLKLKDSLNKQKPKYQWKKRIDIDKLKEILDCKDKYNDFKDFKKRRLIPTINSINSNTDICITKHYKVRNTNEILFEFEWQEWNQKQQKFLPNFTQNIDNETEILDDETKKKLLERMMN